MKLKYVKEDMENLTERDLNCSTLETNSTGERDVVTETVFRAVSGLCFLIMLIGIPGNVLVIASISLNKHLRTAPNFLVLSLSVFDFLFLSIVLPVHTYCYLTGWQPPPNVCWAVGFATNWLLACSVLSTGSIAINRYIAIVIKSKYRHISSNKAVIATCTFVLLFPFCLLSPTFAGSVGTFGFGEHDRNCGWDGYGILRMITIGCVAIFPLVFMTLCYIRIVLFVITSRKKVGEIGETSTAARGTNRNKEARLSLMLGLAYVVYALTTLIPLTLNLVAEMGVAVSYSAYLIGFVVVWMSTAANPVIYGLVNKKYRDAYKNVAARISKLTRGNTERGTTFPNI